MFGCDKSVRMEKCTSIERMCVEDCKSCNFFACIIFCYKILNRLNIFWLQVQAKFLALLVDDNATN